METLSIIKQVVDGNPENFRFLSSDFTQNFTEPYWDGRWAEHIFRMSAFVRVPSFVEAVGDNYKLINEPSIKMKSGNKSGKADAILASDDTVILVSCKWGNFHGRDAYDASKLKDLAFDAYSTYKHIFGYVGKDPNFSNDNEISFNEDFLIKCWEELWAYLVEYDFNWNEINESCKTRKVLKYKRHQLDAILRAKEVFQNHRDCLFYHSPRTGKTITALGTAKNMGAKKILWITPMPSINYQVTDTLLEFDKFKSWTFYDYNDRNSSGSLQSSNVIVCSFQRINNQEKYQELFDINWDMIIIDEVHTHSESNNNQDILDNLNSPKRLWLSATPFKNILLGRFDATNTHQFTNQELYTLKKTDKNYAKYPQINYLLYSSDAVKTLIQTASSFYDKDEWFTFSKLFEISNGQFVYQNQVKEFVEGFFINQYNRLGLRSLDVFQKTKNILLFVPSIEIQELLSKMMASLFDQHKMQNVYSVDFTNSNINSGKTLKDWILSNNRNAKQVNIVLAVEQLSCGVTLPACDMVVMWNDGKSEAEYIQRAERCKNPKDNVQDVYVVDFNPHRCLQSHGMQIEANSGKEISVQATVAYLDHINIMLYDDKEKFKTIDPRLFVSHFEKHNYPLRTFSRIQTNDALDKKTITLLNQFISEKNKKEIHTKLLDEDLGREDSIQNKVKISASSPDEENAEPEPIKDEMIQKIKSLKELIPWWFLITKFKHKNLSEIFDAMRAD